MLARFQEVDPELNRLAHEVIGAAMEVYTHLGAGYSENVYSDALEVELKLRGIAYERDAPVFVNYKGHQVGKGYIDFLIDGVLVIELKVVECILSVHRAQVISYLKARGLQLGIILNFNHTHLRQGIKRIIRSESTSASSASSAMKGLTERD